MKSPIFLTCLFTAFLASCSGSSKIVEATPVVITVEVTRIIQITTSPIPTQMLTPTPTLTQGDIARTAIAKMIGTPIVASAECYETAQSQRELTGCAAARLEKLQNNMDELLKVIEAHYQHSFPEGLEKFKNYHAEWKDFSDRECMTRSGLDGDGWAGTMAPMNYGECMVSKYEDRLREYQIAIFEWTN
jgi:hypothetical protein